MRPGFRFCWQPFISSTTFYPLLHLLLLRLLFFVEESPTRPLLSSATRIEDRVLRSHPSFVRETPKAPFPFTIHLFIYLLSDPFFP